MMNDALIYQVSKELLGEEIIAAYAEDYNCRLSLQKAIYIFQQAAQVNAYDYSWYVAGPYSSALTSQVYNSLLPNLENDTFKETIEKATLTEEGHTIVNRAKKYLDLSKNPSFLEDNSLTQTGFLELMASMLYLRKHKKDKKDTLEMLVRTKGEKFGTAPIDAVVNTMWERTNEFV